MRAVSTHSAQTLDLEIGAVEIEAPDSALGKKSAWGIGRLGIVLCGAILQPCSGALQTGLDVFPAEGGGKLQGLEVPFGNGKVSCSATEIAPTPFGGLTG